MKRTEYRASSQAGFTRVDHYEGNRLVSLVHYLKTRKLAQEVTNALNAAYQRGLADGFAEAERQVYDQNGGHHFIDTISLEKAEYED